MPDLIFPQRVVLTKPSKMGVWLFFIKLLLFAAIAIGYAIYNHDYKALKIWGLFFLFWSPIYFAIICAVNTSNPANVPFEIADVYPDKVVYSKRTTTPTGDSDELTVPITEFQKVTAGLELTFMPTVMAMPGDVVLVHKTRPKLNITLKANVMPAAARKLAKAYAKAFNLPSRWL